MSIIYFKNKIKYFFNKNKETNPNLYFKKIKIRIKILDSGNNSYESSLVARKKFNFLLIKLNKNEIKSYPNCPICLNEFKLHEKVILLPCLHFYHKKCIFEWFKRKRTCPYCQTPYAFNLKNMLNKRQEKIKK